jgi:hypothetical protein
VFEHRIAGPPIGQQVDCRGIRLNAVVVLFVRSVDRLGESFRCR